MKIIFVLLLIIHLNKAPSPGLDIAVRLLTQRIHFNSRINDIILQGRTTLWQEHAYRMQVTRTRLGIAWEYVCTDFGYIRQKTGIDLINKTRRIAIELKNSDATLNSASKRSVIRMLKRFKKQNPTFTVMLAIINSNPHRSIKNGITFIKGRSFLDFIFGTRQEQIISTLRTAITT